MTKPDGVELALLHALRYEEMKIKTSDTKERWDITDDEVKLNTDGIVKFITINFRGLINVFNKLRLNWSK